ncbi:hypothetical protein TNCV_4106111 [Trichonephila clavipes]|nr:hypothetical protein TNCV_4106111 [Trichonephila clavipes]
MSTTAEAYHNVSQFMRIMQYRDESTCRRFWEGDRRCQDQARSRRPLHAGENIDQAMRNNPNATVQELTDTFLQWSRGGW